MTDYELKTSEGRFIYKERNMKGHFIIDCACGGKDDQYHGSRYKNASKGVKKTFTEYEPFLDSKSEHTFYMNNVVFLSVLESRKTEKNHKHLVIVCNDCNREFPFTHESYLELKGRIMDKYFKGLIETEKAHGGE